MKNWKLGNGYKNPAASASGIPLSPELKEFLDGKETTRAIAQRYNISPATLTVRAKRAGVPLRGRGRWRRSQPTPVQKEIIALAKTQSYKLVGSRFGLSKQRVHQLIRRWDDRPFSKNQNKKTGNPLRVRVITFRIEESAFQQLTVTLQHPWFKRLRSPNRAAREILYKFLSGLQRPSASGANGTGD